MRLHITLALLFGALSACEPPLPEGAYNPQDWVPPGAGVDLSDAGRPEDAGTAAPLLGGIAGGPGGTAGGTVGGTGGVEGGVAGGMTGGGTMGGDAGVGTQLSPLAQRMDKLAGSYLVRMDMQSTTSLQQLGIRVTTSNTVSHLLITRLVREGEQLRAVERLCYQTFAHRCTAGCNTLRTAMSPAVIGKLIELDLPRTYKLNDMTLTGETQDAYFGFDSSSKQTLPTSSSDARVWDPVSGGAREGMLLLLSLEANLKKFQNCGVYNVQKFTSSFSGKIGGTSDAPALGGVMFSLTSSSDGNTLGSTSSDCGGDGPQAQTTKGTETVRFVAVEDNEIPGFDNCPAQNEWDKRMPQPNP